MTSDAWKVGIEDDVRRMALAGATDEQLQCFIDARRRGDTALANRLRSLSHEAPSRPAVLTPLQRLRVASLRPVVTSLDAHALYAYIGLLWPLTERLVRDHQDPNQWVDDTFVESLAKGLVFVVLEQLQRGSGLGGPPAAH